MQFHDREYGVTFDFPASWTFGEGPVLGSIPVEGQILRAVVFETRISEIAGWPATSFAGDELEYAVQPVTSPEMCAKLALSPTDVQGGVDSKTIGGMVWNHDASDTGSAGHEALQNDYTAYTKHSGGACLLFRLTVHYLNGRPGNSPPRFLTSDELAAAKAELQEVFSTVRIDTPSTTQFSDPEYGVTFRYPVDWTLDKTSNFYSPLSVFGNRLPVRAVIFTKRIAGVPSWPATQFEGLELGYAAKPAAFPEACRNLSLLASRGDNSAIDRRTLRGIQWDHGHGGEGSAGHGIDEDIFTTWTSRAGGVCVVFDLAVHSVDFSSADSKNPRAMTESEEADATQQLVTVVSSVRLAPPLHPAAPAPHP